ncbi:MAG: hypothetical protein HY822_13215, partial [Acidobacteria bacterium]|nr:hypothetical protein [Acidobacteriota bacterium]
DLWSVAELRLYRGAVELPRDGRWRLRARPNPWDVQLAFDNSPVTRWRSWQPIAPGMYIESDFGRPEPLGEVRLDCSTDQYKVAMRLEGRDPDGRWRTLGDQPEAAARPPMAGLRPAAMAEFKARGVEYLVVFPGDFGYHDLVARADEWGIELVGDRAGARLYRME